MKKLFFTLLLSSFLFASCSRYAPLYEKTDMFVDKLTTTYESYGLSGSRHSEMTPDNEFFIEPLGRMIIVRHGKPLTEEQREKVRKSLERHYKGDKRVNEVFINKAGAIVVDCRR